MATSSSADAARKALGARLREIRVAAGLSGVALAKAAGWHRTKVPKLEAATTLPTPDDIRAWCAACGADDQADDLIARRVAIDTAWTDWRRLERAGLRAAQESTRDVWTSSRHVRAYSPWIVPGPVQTEPYIRALLTATRERRGIVVDDVEAAVRERVQRQQAVVTGPRRIVVVVEACVLGTRIGGVDVLRGQLAYLLEAMALPSVALGVVPVDADRAPLRPVEMFFVFDDERVSAEFVSGWLRVSAADEVAQYVDAFERLASMAVWGDSARSLISTALEVCR